MQYKNKNGISTARYTIPPLEKGINSLIDFIFYYRLFFVIISLITLFIFSLQIWNSSGSGDKYKNVATLFTFGSIVIGIFYSIINYEYNQRRFRHDVQTAREHLAFRTALDWQKKEMVDYCDMARVFYEKHKDLLNQGNVLDFQNHLDKDENDKLYTGTLSVLNFCESVALGVKKGIIDEEFTKAFFGAIFVAYYSRYAVWIEFRRRQRQNVKIWENFTELANNWLIC